MNEPRTDSLPHDPGRDISARRAAGALACLFLVSALVRRLAQDFVAGPHVFSDEVLMFKMADSIWTGRGLFWDELQINYPCWAYPALISPLVRWLPLESAHKAVGLLNANLMSLAIPLTYGIARELGSRRIALRAAFLAALLPGPLYSAMMMADALFYPMFIGAMWLALRAIDRPTTGRRIAAGLLFGLLFHVKPQGLFAPPIFALTVGLIALDRLRSEPPGDRLRRFSVSLGQHWLTALAWLAALTPRLIEIALFEKTASPFSFTAFSGIYHVNAVGDQAINYGDFTSVAMGLGVAWILGTGLLPAAMLARDLPDWIRGRLEPRLRAHLALTLIASLFVAFFAARHVVSLRANAWQIPERYVIVVYPMIMAYFCLREADASGRKSEEKSGRLILKFGSLLVCLIIGLYCARRGLWSLGTDSPTFSAFVPALLPEHYSASELIFLVTLAIGTGLLLISAGASRARRYAAICMILLCYNASFSLFHDTVLGPLKKDDRRTAQRTAERIGSEGRLMILYDGFAEPTVMHAAFLNRGSVAYVSEINKPWYSEPMEIAEDGTVAPKFEGAPNWLLAHRMWKFNRPAAKRFKEANLYRIDDAEPLRMLPAQVAVRREGPKDFEVEGIDEVFAKLSILLFEWDRPEVFEAGRLHEFSAIICNASGFTLSAEDGQLALGYHWSDPDRTGSWESIVWDDGRYVELPDLKPGEVAELEFEIMAPDEPSDTWQLTIAPLAMIEIEDKRDDEIKWLTRAEAAVFLGIAPVVQASAVAEIESKNELP